MRNDLPDERAKDVFDQRRERGRAMSGPEFGSFEQKALIEFCRRTGQLDRPVYSVFREITHSKERIGN